MIRRFNLQAWNFATTNKVSIEQVRNPNLKFEGDEWTLNLYPFYPQIFKKKTKNIYQISPNSTVLAMTFISRAMDEEVAWQNRKSITLKFKELGALLGAQIGSNREISIQTDSPMSKIPRAKVLTISNNPQKQLMKFKLDSLIEKPREPDAPRIKQQEWSITTNFAYNDYRVIYKLLESSIYELSGWKFMMEFQKKQQLSKVERMIYDDNQFQQLIKN